MGLNFWELKFELRELPLKIGDYQEEKEGEEEGEGEGEGEEVGVEVVGMAKISQRTL